MKKLYIYYPVTLLVMMIIINGCARYPSVVTPVIKGAFKLKCEMHVRGKINPSSYYFLVFDDTADPNIGPVPVGRAPSAQDIAKYGDAWSILGPVAAGANIVRPNFYIEYSPQTGGSFRQFRLRADGQSYELVGNPLLGEVTSNNDGLRVEVESSAISLITPTILKMNWITMDDITFPTQVNFIKDYDALGPQGNDFFAMQNLGISAKWESGLNGVADEKQYNEIYPTGLQESSTDIPALDIIKWSTELVVQ
jgi:hypothetical protein